MSKIGKTPISIPEGVNVSAQNNIVTITGGKGTFSYTLPKDIKIEIKDGILKVTQKDPNNDGLRALYGLTRANLANLITGVSSGFEKKLELSGVGYRAILQGTNLSLSVGFSHPVIIPSKEGITYQVKDNIISISGADKVQVGEMAAKIRAIRKPEPYKGKGIKYVGERIRRKAGKAAKAVGGK